MLKPLRDYVLVEADPYQENASDFILIPQSQGIIDSQAQYGRCGTVVSVGPGIVSDKGILAPTAAKPGDRVAWGEFDFPRYEEKGKTYFIIQEADITGILTQE